MIISALKDRAIRGLLLKDREIRNKIINGEIK
jgi:hypothetical protein